MYRMYGIAQGAKDGSARMYRMYGQIFAPAISALPPSVVVVCHGAMDGKERRMYDDTVSATYKARIATAFPPSVEVRYRTI